MNVLSYLALKRRLLGGDTVGFMLCSVQSASCNEYEHVFMIDED